MAGQPPQYNSGYDPRPQPGYNQGADYQQGYGQPAPPGYGQPGPYPMMMPVAVPPKKDNTVTIVVVVVVVVIMLIIIIPMALSFMLVSQMQSMPQSGGTVETQLGIRVEKNANNDWIVSVTVGSSDTPSQLYLQIVDANTGAKTVNARLTSGPTSDFTFNDNNANGKLDAGDSILLKGSSSNIRAGYTFQIAKSESIIAGPRSLP
jgi:hypothetical protein